MSSEHWAAVASEELQQFPLGEVDPAQLASKVELALGFTATCGERADLWYACQEVISHDDNSADYYAGIIPDGEADDDMSRDELIMKYLDECLLAFKPSTRTAEELVRSVEFMMHQPVGTFRYLLPLAADLIEHDNSNCCS